MYEIVPFTVTDRMFRKLIVAVLGPNQRISMVSSAPIWKVESERVRDPKSGTWFPGFKVQSIGQKDHVLSSLSALEELGPFWQEKLREAAREWGWFLPEEGTLSGFKQDGRYYFLLRYSTQVEALIYNFLDNKRLYQEDPKYRDFFDKMRQARGEPLGFPEKLEIKEDWKPARCPICNSELLVAGKARFQTLEEHVTHPDGQASLKYILGCCNPHCAASVMELYWDEVEKSLFLPGRSCPLEHIRFIGGASGAVGGFSRTHELEELYRESHTHYWSWARLGFQAYLVWNPLRCHLTLLWGGKHLHTLGCAHYWRVLGWRLRRWKRALTVKWNQLNS